MKTRSRYLKTAVTVEEYAAAIRRADEAGLKLSAYLRAVLFRDEEPPPDLGGCSGEELRELLLPTAGSSW